MTAALGTLTTTLLRGGASIGAAGKFCTVGQRISDSAAYSAVSSDGGASYAYGAIPIGTTNIARTVAHDGTVFFTIDYGTTSGASTPDGLTWTARTLPLALQYVAGSPGLLVAIAYGTASYATSTDHGVSWTTRTLPLSKGWISIIRVNGLFIIGSSNTGDILTSADGITWNSYTAPGNAFSIAWNGTYYFGCIPNGAAWRTTNFAAFDTITIPLIASRAFTTVGGGTTTASSYWWPVTAVGSYMLAIDFNGSRALACSKDNGTTWQILDAPWPRGSYQLHGCVTGSTLVYIAQSNTLSGVSELIYEPAFWAGDNGCVEVP